jgi:hypothetical protein
MKTSLSKYILAAVTLDRTLVGGGVPIFVARDRPEQDRIATTLARITTAVAHDLENGVYVLVKH